jgi:hypothetical protein
MLPSYPLIFTSNRLRLARGNVVPAIVVDGYVSFNVSTRDNIQNLYDLLRDRRTAVI